MGHAGRPSLLTQEVQDKICQALRAGNFRKASAEWAGVSPRVFRDWMELGRKRPKSRYGEFRRAVIQAEKGAEILAVGKIMAAAQEDVEHFKWWITHRHRHWAIKQKIEHSGDPKRPVRIEAEMDLRNLSDDDLETLERIALKAEAASAEDDSSGEGESEPS